MFLMGDVSMAGEAIIVPFSWVWIRCFLLLCGVDRRRKVVVQWMLVLDLWVAAVYCCDFFFSSINV